MSKNKTVLAADARAKAGKGAARAVRREGKIPAVIYGDHKEPVLLSIVEKELVKAASKKSFYTQLCDLKIGNDTFLVLPREVQLNPVTDRPEHADFLRVSEKTVIRVHIPVTVINEKAAPGIAKGGVVNLVHHEIDVFARATDIPEEFVADLTGLEIGGALHIEDLKMPKGVKPAQTGNFTVVTLVAPSAMKSDDTAAVPGADAAAPAAAAGAAKPAAKPAAKK
jgi:large subunit ribosomal protein L25